MFINFNQNTLLNESKKHISINDHNITDKKINEDETDKNHLLNNIKIAKNYLNVLIAKCKE